MPDHHAIQAAREDVEEVALRAAFAVLPQEGMYERGVGSRRCLLRAERISAARHGSAPPHAVAAINQET